MSSHHFQLLTIPETGWESASEDAEGERLHEIVLGGGKVPVWPKFDDVYPLIDYSCLQTDVLRYYKDQVDWYMWMAKQCEVPEVGDYIHDAIVTKDFTREQVAQAAEDKFDKHAYMAFESTNVTSQAILLMWS